MPEVLDVLEVMDVDLLLLKCLHQMVHVDYYSSEYLAALEIGKQWSTFWTRIRCCYFSTRSSNQIVKVAKMPMASQSSTSSSTLLENSHSLWQMLWVGLLQPS